jgi:hypothetical protein
VLHCCGLAALWLHEHLTLVLSSTRKDFSELLTAISLTQPTRQNIYFISRQKGSRA